MHEFRTPVAGLMTAFLPIEGADARFFIFAMIWIFLAAVHWIYQGSRV